MADKDVNYYIDQINAAVRGEDVRSAIIALLEMANSGASNAYTLNGLTSDRATWNRYYRCVQTPKFRLNLLKAVQDL